MNPSYELSDNENMDNEKSTSKNEELDSSNLEVPIHEEEIDSETQLFENDKASASPNDVIQNSETSPTTDSTEDRNEYHFDKPELDKLYKDAQFVPEGESTEPPRYYVPPEKKYNTKKRNSSSKGFGWKLVCLCLICAILGGVAGGAIINGINSKKNNNTQTVASSEAPSGGTTTTVVAEKTGTMTAAEIYNQATEQVVGVSSDITYTNIFGQTSDYAITGTGFFISTDGYILTNYHVISDAYSSSSTITILLYDGSSYEASVAGTEADNDLALLKIEKSDCNAVTFADSSQISIGDTCYAVGNPLGELNFTMTSGIVSALDREVMTSSYESAINMFQFDAAINNGNSGGPLYNANGEVIGVISAKASSSGSSVEGLGFAIPSNDASKIANDLITAGYVTGKAYMGVSIDTNYTSSVSQYYGLPDGAFVKEVVSGSAAEKAGIQSGDIITKVGDTDITSYTDLTSTIKKYSAGDTVDIELYRSGNTISVSVTFNEEKSEKVSSNSESNSGNKANPFADNSSE